ncbi:MAG: DEAD/DEAH box helicase [Muribaculaceae bacterium]
MKESEILLTLKAKHGIEELNEMQKKILSQSTTSGDMIILSPTGSGKTIAFLLPILKSLKPSSGKVQVVIIAPSRELVTQIDSVARSLAVGYKTTCCYGGHSVIDEKQSLAITPDIIVGTPGRLLDHINRKNIDLLSTRFLILDEFDKSLELGFQEEMQKIVKRMPNLSRRILTSATSINEMPEFVGLQSATTYNFLQGNASLRDRLTVWEVKSTSNDKLEMLLMLLNNVKEGRTIVFANHREAVERIYDYLMDNYMPAGMYHGGLEQIDREKALSMFNNGTYRVLVTTDLGSRGLDIAEVTNIIHYHLPSSSETYTHRNGRSARVNATGEIYVITSPTEKIPAYIVFDGEKDIDENAVSLLKKTMTTLYFQAGKKEKISRGDIVGFLVNQGGLQSDEIGQIDLKDHYTLVAIPALKTEEILDRIATQKIKNKRVRISVTF